MRNDKTKSVCVVTGSGSISVKAGAQFSMLYTKDGADAAAVYVIDYVREVFARFFVADVLDADGNTRVRSFRYDRIEGRA